MVFLYYLNRVAYETYRNGEFGHYRRYPVHVTIRRFNTDIDDVIYQGCPLDYCKKKVQPTNDGSWYCEKCEDCHSDFKYRYKLKAYLDDGTMRPFMVTMFDNTAGPLLRITAPNLEVLHDSNHAKYDSIFEEVKDQTYYLRLNVALVHFGHENYPRTRLNGIVAGFGI